MKLTDYPYPSRRIPVLAPRGVVATSQPLAAQAGLSMLQQGGSAADAALGYAQLSGPEFAGWAATFARGGHAPRPGETWASPAHARTLRRIAASQAADFYQGDLARAIAGFATATGGWLTEADLAEHTS